MTRLVARLLFGCLAVAVLVRPMPSSAEPAPPFARMWGSYGSGPGELRGPFGIAIAPSGLVYVADQYNHRVQIFSATGDFAGQFGAFGTEPGQLNNPYGIAVALDGSVFVVDRENARIEKFTAAGQFLMEWNGSSSPGGAFIQPLGIAIAPDGTLLIGDGRRHEVYRYSQDGQYIATLIGSFVWPEAFAIEPDGRFWVTSGGELVTHCSPDGTVLSQFSVYSGGAGLALDANGDLYVVEHSTYTVDKYSTAGQLLVTWGGPGTGPGQFMEPAGIAIDQSGFIYISDIANNRIQVFGDSPVPTSLTSWGRMKAAYRQ